jgi:ankyrin repeat protein
MGADLDAPDLQGNTPLHCASAWGKIPVRCAFHHRLQTSVADQLLQLIKLLIELDCQQAKNNEGFTAAEYAYS